MQRNCSIWIQGVLSGFLSHGVSYRRHRRLSGELSGCPERERQHRMRTPVRRLSAPPGRTGPSGPSGFLWEGGRSGDAGACVQGCVSEPSGYAVLFGVRGYGYHHPECPGGKLRRAASEAGEGVQHLPGHGQPGL